MLAGIPVWGCELQYPVIPVFCKVKAAGKRVEVKLRKVKSEKWMDVGQPLPVDVKEQDQQKEEEQVICSEDNIEEPPVLQGKQNAARIEGSPTKEEQHMETDVSRQFKLHVKNIALY